MPLLARSEEPPGPAAQLFLKGDHLAIGNRGLSGALRWKARDREAVAAQDSDGVVGLRMRVIWLRDRRSWRRTAHHDVHKQRLWRSLKHAQRAELLCPVALLREDIGSVPLVGVRAYDLPACPR
jgi:hypothetical protein